MRNKLLLFMCLYFSHALYSQNFNYSLTKDSSAYTALSSPTVLISNEQFGASNFGIHLPFIFNFCGSTTDSLIIETNGFIVLDVEKQYAITVFNNFKANADSTQHYVSSIGYTVSGTTGNRILKLEFNKLSQNQYNTYDHLSYQVWLHENGNKISFRIGPNYLSTIPQPVIPTGVSEEDVARLTQGNSVLLGLINKNMNTSEKALLIKGDRYHPQTQIITGDNELVYLQTIPSKGIVLELAPTF